MSEVHMPGGEALENALKRFKSIVRQEDLIDEIKRRSFALKSGEKKRATEGWAANTPGKN